MKLSYQAKTAIGLRRTANFDEFHLNEAKRFFLVSDGYGKRTDDGTTASELGVMTIAKYLSAQSEEPQTWPQQMTKSPALYTTHLRAALKLANHVVYQMGLPLTEEWDLQGFGASVAVLWFVEESAFVTHLGHCRVYRMRNGRLDQLTEDHTHRMQVKKLYPNRSEEELMASPNALVLSLGYEREPEVDVLREKVSAGDLYLLCTNGVHDNLTDKELAAILSSQKDLQTICEQLIARGNQNERADNSTVILVRCE